jgi:hypothetical protein
MYGLSRTVARQLQAPTTAAILIAYLLAILRILLVTALYLPGLGFPDCRGRERRRSGNEKPECSITTCLQHKIMQRVLGHGGLIAVDQPLVHNLRATA